ncbi:MAG: Fic family protein, partial [Firmicutes bacterium]|nr:Fic family protein [Bacillota bacterium]
RLLEVSTRGAWEEWLLFFLRGVESQARDAAERAARLLELRRGYRERFQRPRASAVLPGLVDLLFRCPVITVPLAARQLGVTYATAARQVESLVRAGVLREAKRGRAGVRRRNRVFVAEEVLAAVEGPLTPGA